MSPCLNYITGNSSTPSSSCCTQLANVYVKSLMVLPPHSGSGQSLMGVNIVQTRALALPGACNVQTPSIGRCNASSPTDSPSGAPNSLLQVQDSIKLSNYVAKSPICDLNLRTI
ncbi:NON-SPECIFIC LIPID TRANSFER PROTEIN GPI-ANCHORED 2-LIKE ISOFORM X1 [Salix koriyanagi]|uniref:NON-SPECIFIC LIPID TRANSFER PROTEIN GPI-ANCHORED 2-LIKE ISOFORM X1 n=1 Tax=Salix koriyanagi TaxID=2511006 RepID=A0A9Q0QN02_9ROSI|nr:NON-SPECIFIC LIPID TRANSFER PROTEIN GPI-ANCHORED 2-LIKE ISOFORM X1 [Salix koriyanagi]